MSHEEWKQRQQNLKDLANGKRKDVYPAREDIPAELWGTIIPNA